MIGRQEQKEKTCRIGNQQGCVLNLAVGDEGDKMKRLLSLEDADELLAAIT